MRALGLHNEVFRTWIKRLNGYEVKTEGKEEVTREEGMGRERPRDGKLTRRLRRLFYDCFHRPNQCRQLLSQDSNGYSSLSLAPFLSLSTSYEGAIF